MVTAPDRLLHHLEWHVVRRLEGRLNGAYRTNQRGAGVDLAGLREYVDTDDARRIDWSATARTGETLVREYNEDRDLTVWLVLDPLGIHGRGRRGPHQGRRPDRAGAPRPTLRGLGQPGRGSSLRRCRGQGGRDRDEPGQRCASATSSSRDTGSVTTTDLAGMLDAVAVPRRRAWWS